MSARTCGLASLRSRWSAIGAAVAVSLGAGGIGLAQAAIGSGDKPVTVTIEPTRILDTRNDLGLAGGFTGGVPRDLQVTGNVPIAPSGTATVVPSDAVAVLVNVTVVRPDSSGYLTLRPAGVTGDPSTSTVNFLAGTIEPNAATVDLGPGGKVQIYVFTDVPGGTAHVLLDVVGYTIDHHHDDRYYTEGEVDAKLAAIPAWGTIPSGSTVVGPIRWDEQSSVASGDYRYFVSFPARAPAQPNGANWAPDSWTATTDDDPQCTGNSSAPTAPPGKVCLYLINTSLTSGMTGEVFPTLLDSGFEVWWTVTGTGDMFVYGTWAYTAP